MRARGNLTTNQYKSGGQRVNTFALELPSAQGNSSIRGSTSTGEGGYSNVEISAQSTLIEMANEPGSSTLKMRLAQEGVSLTDDSDVGPDKRFKTFSEKLAFVMKLKLSYLMAITMSMVSSSGWGPSGSDADVDKARAELFGPEGPMRRGDSEGSAQRGNGASPPQRGNTPAPDRKPEQAEKIDG